MSFFFLKKFLKFFVKFNALNYFFSSLIKTSFIFKPLFAMILLPSLLDGKILLLDKKSNIFIPF